MSSKEYGDITSAKVHDMWSDALRVLIVTVFYRIIITLMIEYPVHCILYKDIESRPSSIY